MMERILVLCALLLTVAMLSGCDSSSDTDSTTSFASATTSGPNATTASNTVVEVGFDGEECTLAESEVGSGDISFVLTNTSGVSGFDVYVRRIDAGHSYEEMVQIYEETVGQGQQLPRPDWVLGVDYAFGLDRLDLADNQIQIDHRLDPGPHMVFGGTLVSVDGIAYWMCGPLEVRSP